MNCPNNLHVLCYGKKNCGACGWNPVVHNARINKLLSSWEAAKAEAPAEEGDEAP